MSKKSRNGLSELRTLVTELARQNIALHEVVTRTSQTVEQVSQSVGALSNRWGQFIESFLAPGIVRVFQERGIPIHQTHQRSKARIDNQRMEIDLLGVNDEYVVAVEVKSNLQIEDIDDHLVQLANLKRFFPEYARRKVLGAVAGIKISAESDKYAVRHGLFVIGQSGETVVILNPQDFMPKVW